MTGWSWFNRCIWMNIQGYSRLRIAIANTPFSINEKNYSTKTWRTKFLFFQATISHFKVVIFFLNFDIEKWKRNCDDGLLFSSHAWDRTGISLIAVGKQLVAVSVLAEKNVYSVGNKICPTVKCARVCETMLSPETESFSRQNLSLGLVLWQAGSFIARHFKWLGRHKKTTLCNNNCADFRTQLGRRRFNIQHVTDVG